MIRPMIALLLASANALALASLSVSKVEFAKAQALDGREEWFETSIELEVLRDEGDAARRHPDFLDGVTVRLEMGLRSDGPTRNEFEFYPSEVTLVSLEKGKSVARFYLPPEVVRRDRIRGEPTAYAVEVLRGGETLCSYRSASLKSEVAQGSFRSRLAARAPENDGVLLPQQKTPFVLDYVRSTPSYREKP